MYYILKDKQPIPVTLMEWATWNKIENRIVKQEEVLGVQVSTVFLGIDHSLGNEKPILFETMIFGGDLDESCWRYCTWDEAEAGHAKAVQMVKDGKSLNEIE